MVAQNNLCVLILAAGKGTRMKSSLPKPLHPVCGVPMIARSLRAAQALQPGAIGVVVGHESNQVTDFISQNLSAWGITAPVRFIEQKDLSGTGSAVRAAQEWFAPFSQVMVLNGDTPLVRPQTLQAMYDLFLAQKAGVVVLSITVPDPSGYGRMVRAADGSFARIVEHADADEQTLQIAEVNSGMYVFDVPALTAALARLTPQGPKQEYYLTDTLAFIKETLPALVFNTSDYMQALGVNCRADLALAEKLLRAQINTRLMESGVRLVCPEQTYVDETAQIGPDTVIYPNCYIEGNSVIGAGCRLESNVYIKDSHIESGVNIRMGSYLESASVATACEVGPYARLRPKAELKHKAKVGNFCEVKNAVIGEGSKVNHLTYIGDTDMGAGVNIGAGTITCNYDGQKKHRTVIGDHCFVGSNVNFVAPVEVKPYSRIGAGSTITKEVPENSLAVERSRQVVLENKGTKKHD